MSFTYDAPGSPGLGTRHGSDGRGSGPASVAALLARFTGP
jgi:hypothetical protein